MFQKRFYTGCDFHLNKMLKEALINFKNLAVSLNTMYNRSSGSR